MADDPHLRTLLETEEYSAQCDFLRAFYSAEVIEPILNGLLWGIAKGPTAYERVHRDIRAAKSKSFNLRTPAFQILFQILDQNQPTERVLLCWIEEVDPSDRVRDF